MQLISHDAKLKERMDEDERAAIELAVTEREKALLPVYAQIAEQFADLHDAPGRMKAKGVVRDIVEWRDARRFFYARLRRRLAEFKLRDRVIKATSVSSEEEKLSPISASKLVKKWFTSSSSFDVEKWEDDKVVMAWLREEEYAIEKKLIALKTESVARAVKSAASFSEEGLIEGLRSYMSNLPRDKAEVFANDLSDILDL